MLKLPVIHIVFSYSLISLFFLSAIFISQAFSQTPKQWTKLGDEASVANDFIGAAIYYQKAYSLDSSNSEIIYKYAEALRKSNNYSLAEFYYQKHLDSEKKAGQNEAAAQQGSRNGLTLFWLATMQKFNGDYKNALENFRKFEKVYGDKSSYYSRKSKQEVKSCAFAQKLILDTLPVKIDNAGHQINTFNSEINAFLADDSTLFFSSLRPDSLTGKNPLKESIYKMKIYTAVKKENSWVSNSPLDTAINNPKFFNGNGTFSKDKKRFYFSRCSEDFKCAVYLSEAKPSGNKGSEVIWNTPAKLENGINSENFSSTQPMLAEIDGEEILFFVSDMPGGKGKLDIWNINLSEIKSGKANARPKNLSKINTADNEISPFYSTENKTLYFSSEWYFGLGGFDIFKSKYTRKNFSSPENAGIPYNSSVNDMYFSFYPQSGHGFLTSNRKGSFSNSGETCCNDIYEYFLSEKEKKDTLPLSEKKYSSLEMLNKYLPVTLYFHNDEPNPKSRDTITPLNYLRTFENYLGLTETYNEEYAKGLKGENKEKAVNDIEVFFADYVEKGVSDLELFSELLLKELEKGQNIEIIVKGYASPLAKTDYNVNLTLRRISSMQNYLYETQDGAFVPYFNQTSPNGGSLNIVKIPFGEYQSDTTVSDNLNDQRNSVYSRKAALERKIEIISVTQANKDSVFPEISFEEEIFDFGSAAMGEKLSHNFTFKNSGKKNLLIKNVTSSCGCTVAKWTRNELPPEGKGEIEIIFDTEGKFGKQVKTVTIETNANPSTRAIHVTAEISPP